MCRHFYPRSPRGERRKSEQAAIQRAEFLSTLPARGATFARPHPHPLGDISIDAPREGSDACCNQCPGGGSGFLSTLPARGATRNQFDSSGRTLFLSTLPARGATETNLRGGAIAQDFYPRSPRGERPLCEMTRATSTQHFYPRSPRGERLCCWRLSVKPKQFLSTLPARGATAEFAGQAYWR